MTKRIARAKDRIRKERIPYEIPSRAELARRLAAVLQVVYLVYNEGFVTTAGQALSRRDLAEDALYLGRLIVDLLPEPEAIGLLGLMLLHESRRPARVDAQGDVIPLEDQDRSLWNRELIAEGIGLVHRALLSGRFGPTPSRPPLPGFMPWHRRSRQRIGFRSSASTTCFWRQAPRLSWNSTGQSPWPCVTGQPPGWPSSTPFSTGESLWITTRPMPCVPT